MRNSKRTEFKNVEIAVAGAVEFQLGRFVSWS